MSTCHCLLKFTVPIRLFVQFLFAFLLSFSCDMFRRVAQDELTWSTSNKEILVEFSCSWKLSLDHARET